MRSLWLFLSDLLRTTLTGRAPAHAESLAEVLLPSTDDSLPADVAAAWVAQMRIRFALDRVAQQTRRVRVWSA
jgi:hypothetical protein